MKTKILIGLIVLIGLLPAGFVFAQNPDLQERIILLKQQIADLQSKIVELKAQLAEIQTPEFKFTKTLQLEMRDDEVKTLQEFLKQSQEIYPEGLVTGYFGPLTEAAVKRFQEKHSIESIGIVGPKTRQKLNELFSVQEKIEESKEIIPSIPIMPTPSSTPAPTPQFQSGPPPNWPESLKQEREDNIEDVRIAEEFMWRAGRTMENDTLPQFIEWAEERGINLIGIKKTEESKSDFWNLTARKMSLTAVPGVDGRFEMFKKLPEHLLNLARDQAIFFWGEDCIGYASSVWRNEELCQSYQKNLADIPEDIRCIHVLESISSPWSKGGSCLSPYDMFVCKGIGLEIHEFGHIVDFNGIRTYKGREFALGKTDEGILELYNEYKRVFEPTEEQRQWTRQDMPPPGMLSYGQANSKENFAVHFDYYVNQPEKFREKVVINASLAEKYEFLKTKIFLGQEY